MLWQKAEMVRATTCLVADAQSLRLGEVLHNGNRTNLGDHRTLGGCERIPSLAPAKGSAGSKCGALRFSVVPERIALLAVVGRAGALRRRGGQGRPHRRHATATGGLKLTRFRGHPRICVEGVHDAKQGKEASTISA
jgi:hypothetical protein